MSTERFTDLTYEREIVRVLKKYLIDRCLPHNGEPPRDALVCDELPFNIRQIPVESIIGMVRRLTAEEGTITTELNHFTHIHNVARPIAQAAEESPPAGNHHDVKAKQKKNKAPARKPAGSGS